MAKFEYRPTRKTTISLPASRPGDILETTDPERIAYYRTLDSLVEIKDEPKKKKSSTKDDDKAEPSD